MPRKKRPPAAAKLAARPKTADASGPRPESHAAPQPHVKPIIPPAPTAHPGPPAPPSAAAAKPAAPWDSPRLYPVVVARAPAAPPAPSLGPVKALAAAGPGKPSLSGPKSGVVVVGSLNMDLIVRAEVMPQPGQTVLGQDLLLHPGGKGGNQATAAARLWHRRGSGSRLVGRLGDDAFGQNILAALRQSKVDTSSVLTTKDAPTGTALILVDRHGESAIVLSGGANRHLSATDLLAQRQTIESSVVLLAQLETPADTIVCAFALAKRSNVLTILNPAPPPPEGLPESLYHVDILTPNQGDAELLSGVRIHTIDDARRAAERFLLRGTRIVVIKMGSLGAVVVYKPDQVRQGAGDGGAKAGGGGAGARLGAEVGPTVAVHVPGFRLPIVDASGTCDAFAGALAVALAEGMALERAVRFANGAAALACTKPGAMAGMPTRAELDHLLDPPATK